MKEDSPMPDCKHTSFNIYNIPVLSTINILVVIWLAMQRTLKEILLCLTVHILLLIPGVYNMAVLFTINIIVLILFAMQRA